MSTDANLLALSIELATQYDPNLDTSAGSPFRTRFLDPLLTRVGVSPLDSDLESFNVARLLQEIPDVDVSPMSGMRDLVIRAQSVLQEPLRREINSVRLKQSLKNYDSMTRAELNSLLANYFIELRDGSKSVGTVRMYFASPRSQTVTPLTSFKAGNGLTFFPTVVQSLTSTQMTFNQEGSLFYMDVSLESESSGELYNVEPGSINSVSGITGLSRVTNLGRFEAGLMEETKAEGIARARNSITVRNLIVDRGIQFVIPEAFPRTTLIQVIGRNDPEMYRDIITGPVDISGIPGGLTGDVIPTLGYAESVHIGGFTDIYVYQPVPDVDTIDIRNLGDKGRRLFAGRHGFTQGDVPGDYLLDNFGLFTRRGISVGDLLYLGRDIFEITVVLEHQLNFISYDGGPSQLDAGLFEQTYEVVRRTPGTVTVPLYDLVAEDSPGNAVIDVDGDPVAPVPGAFFKEKLMYAGSEVKKAENIALGNVKLPLLRVTSVELLDPITLENSGIFVPMSDYFLAQTPKAFTGGGVGTYATGDIRVYFRDAVSAWVRPDQSVFYFDSYQYQPVPEVLGDTYTSLASGTHGTTTLTLSGVNFTPNGLDKIRAGYRIEILSGDAYGIYTVKGGAFIAGNTVLTLREKLPFDVVSDTWKVYVGVNPTTISFDATLNLYYFDIASVAYVTGSGSNLPANAVSHYFNGIRTEGWSLRTDHIATSFSTRELPHLLLSDWVTDEVCVADQLDAYAIRVQYEYANTLKDIQAFVDSPDNRVVAEDVLVRHFTPAYVRAVMTVRGISVADTKEHLEDYVNALSPTKDLELSDVIEDLYNYGCTKVKLPTYMSYMTQTVNRNWTGAVNQDSLGSLRTQHFVLDVASVLITAE